MLATIEDRTEKPAPATLKAWVRAWDNYKLSAFHNIKPPACFKVSDKTSAVRREEYRVIYRIHAVRHFLPYFKKVIPNVRGRALGEIRGIIRFLEGWKNSLPPNTDLSVKIMQKPPSLPDPQPPPKPQERALPDIATVVLPAASAPPDCHGTAVESGDLDHLSSDDTDPDINEFLQQPQFWPVSKAVGRKNPPF